MVATDVRIDGGLYRVHEDGAVYRFDTSVSVFEAEPRANVTLVLVRGTDARRALDAVMHRQAAWQPVRLSLDPPSGRVSRAV